MKESRRLITLMIIMVFLGIVIAYYAYPYYVHKEEGVEAPSEEGGYDTIVFNYTPFAIHVSIMDVSPLTYTFTWVTVSPTNNSLVELITPDGHNITFNGIQLEYRGLYWHIVNVSNISIYSTYKYRVGDPSIEMSELITLPGMLESSSEFIFTVYGDQGVNKYSALAVKTALSYSPAFNIHVGDLSYGGYKIDLWLRWFNIIEPLASTRPYMVAVGNHEYDGEGDLSDINIYLPMPSKSYNYWFNWSNAFFLVLNLGPEDDGSLDPSLYKWVDETLKYAESRGDIKWIFVFLHYPPYSSGASHGSSPVAQPLIELFDKYNVDIVFAGHEHNYERTYPIRGGEIVSMEDRIYIAPGGTIYVVVGGGGGGLYKNFIEPKPTWSVYRSARYSIGVVVVSGDRVVFKAIDTVSGEVFDEFTLIKE